MEPRKLELLDQSGRPLDSRVQRVLRRLLPRLRRQFPTIEDEVTQADVLEEAGRRIARREERSGPLEKIEGYAWVTVRSVATSLMRKASSRLRQRTLGSEASEAVLSTASANSGTPEQIERDILLRELLDQLSPDERWVMIRKLGGLSSQEIAQERGSSVAAVDALYSRTKQKARRMLGVQPSGEADRAATTEPDSDSPKSQSPDEKETENVDGESRPASRSVGPDRRR